jgi:tetratricopeptide (TPR) repeat protein
MKDLILNSKEDTNMDKSNETHQIISNLMNEAHHSMDYEHFEDAVIKLQRCLQLEDEPESRAAILDDLGYCFLRLGWFEEAIKVYTKLLEANPSDNDSRFFLASASSLRSAAASTLHYIGGWWKKLFFCRTTCQ